MSHAREATSGPIRTCRGCGARKPKTALTRIVVGTRGKAVWDHRQTLPGRGAYVCPSADCLAAALKRGKLGRALRQAVDTASLMDCPPPWAAFSDPTVGYETQTRRPVPRG